MASSLIPAQERRKEARGVGETETGLVLTAARYPRQARVWRGSSGRGCGGGPAGAGVAETGAGVAETGAGMTETGGVGETETGLVLTAARYPRRARV